ncbi:MAG: biotin carboxyl carrier protein [Pseudomonadota bacterium]
MTTIRFVDTTLRDGNQSLWDATGITTDAALSVAEQLDNVGFKAVDFMASIHMGVAVRYHKENPWTRIKRVSQAMPNTPLSFGTTGRRFIGFKRMPDCIMGLVYKCMVANGIRRVWLIDAAHETAIIQKNARMAKEAGIEDFMTALSYTISPVHTDGYYAARTGEITACSDVDTVYLKDQGGLLTPERITTLVPAIQANLRGKPLEIHSHCSTGLAPQVYRQAIEAGIDTVHTAIPPLADGTSQPSIFEILDGLEEKGHKPAINGDLLRSISEHLYALAERQNRPVGKPQEYNPSYFEHQVPGGMVTTLNRQLAEAGMTERLPEVLDEIIRVRRDLGYPIMVTPLSQFVGTQATMNIASGERYKMVPDGIIEYVVGYFGSSPSPIDPEILEKINKLPRTKKLREQDFPQPSVEDLKEAMGLPASISDEEFLLRYAMPGQEVDAMQAASA